MLAALRIAAVVTAEAKIAFWPPLAATALGGTIAFEADDPATSAIPRPCNSRLPRLARPPGTLWPRTDARQVTERLRNAKTDSPAVPIGWG
jgi:hypothetical protein